MSAFANSISELLKILETDSEIALNWFSDNDMIANADKFQGMIINRCGRYSDLQKLKIAGFEISTKEHLELLGITIDKKLNFNRPL